jgi:hypothetical protein
MDFNAETKGRSIYIERATLREKKKTKVSDDKTHLPSCR